MALPGLMPSDQGQFLPVKVFDHQGRLYPEPPYGPDCAHREKAWRLALQGISLPSEGEPFRIELSEEMDFTFLVWGPNGAHWEYIQEHFVDPSLNLSWGYKDPVPGKATPFLSRARVARVARMLNLGFANAQCPNSLERIQDLW